MNISNKCLPIIFTVLTAISVSIVTLSGQKSGKVTAAQEVNELNELPIVDYDAPDSTDTDERDKRRAKNKKYDKQSSEPIKEAPYPYERTWSAHWARRLSAIPVAQSDLVLIGEVSEAQAFLSNDRTGVYSDFTISVRETLKNNNNAPLYPGNVVSAERSGGAVRFPSGKIQKYRTSGQGMPRIGRQYVFFLKKTDQDQGYSIITGYELRNDLVVPLDGSDVELPFNKYRGANAATFIAAVRAAINQTAQQTYIEGRSHV